VFDNEAIRLEDEIKIEPWSSKFFFSFCYMKVCDLNLDFQL
jgi:hypothetical protein